MSCTSRPVVQQLAQFFVCIYEAETVIVMAFTLVNGLSGKCVASGRVVVVVSLSSCSFLLLVDEGCM